MFFELNNLHVNYPEGADVIKGINMYVNEGEIVSLLGSNGAGKTTTLKAIAGLLKPSQGEIVFRAENIVNDSPQIRVNKGISMVPEGKRIFKRLTVHQNLLLGAHTQKSQHIRRTMLATITQLFPRLKERMNQNAGTLSGGEQQMLAIGRALMSSPRLLLLDEPTLGIMPKLVNELFNSIKIMRDEMGVSILLVEQNVKKSIEIANRGYILQTGRIVAEGGEELLNSEIVKKAFLGI